MRPWIITICLVFFCFIVPLQFFIIGNDAGYGIQGGVYRYQATVYGNSLIPLPWELTYITSGIYTGTTALSIILWVAGTMVIALTTLISLIRINQFTSHTFHSVIAGLALSGVLYLGSCMARYGVFFSGPAGISLPLGAVLLIIVALFLYHYQDIFISHTV